MIRQTVFIDKVSGNDEKSLAVSGTGRVVEKIFGRFQKRPKIQHADSECRSFLFFRIFGRFQKRRKILNCFQKPCQCQTPSRIQKPLAESMPQLSAAAGALEESSAVSRNGQRFRRPIPHVESSILRIFGRFQKRPKIVHRFRKPSPFLNTVSFQETVSCPEIVSCPDL